MIHEISASSRIPDKMRSRRRWRVAMENIAWMAWTLPTAIFFVLLAVTLA